jgi:hypothetical protein
MAEDTPVVSVEERNLSSGGGGGNSKRIALGLEALRFPR